MQTTLKQLGSQALQSRTRASLVRRRFRHGQNAAVRRSILGQRGEWLRDTTHIPRGILHPEQQHTTRRISERHDGTQYTIRRREITLEFQRLALGPFQQVDQAHSSEVYYEVSVAAGLQGLTLYSEPFISLVTRSISVLSAGERGGNCAAAQRPLQCLALIDGYTGDHVQTGFLHHLRKIRIQVA